MSEENKIPTPGDVAGKNDQIVNSTDQWNVDNPESGNTINRNTDELDNLQNVNNEDMFPRKVVEDLRKENAKYRDRAKQVDALEQQLHTALVRLDGRLADPADLPFNVEHVEDPDKLAAAITELIERNPRMRAMMPAGDAGQRARGEAKQPEFDLLTAIRGY